MSQSTLNTESFSSPHLLEQTNEKVVSVVKADGWSPQIIRYSDDAVLVDHPQRYIEKSEERVKLP